MISSVVERFVHIEDVSSSNLLSPTISLPCCVVLADGSQPEQQRPGHRKPRLKGDDAMPLPPLYVLRHGQTEWNREGRFQGVHDSPLTDKGRAQAMAMGTLIAAEGITAQSHEFLVSPQGRAQETARLALLPIGAAARQVDALREISVGTWNGMLRSEIAERWPAPDPAETELESYARAPGGESFDDMWLRTGDVLASLTRPTVIVTHGITSRFLRTRAMGWGLDRIEELPGGQGVIHVVQDGVHQTLAPASDIR